MSRFVAIAAAIALVVSGVVIGALGTFLVLQRPGFQAPFLPPRPQFQPHPPPPAPFTREMEDRLDLSEDQLKELRIILRESRDASEEIRRELRPRLESQLEKSRARIAQLLNPEQRAKFEQMVKEDRRRAERFFIEGPPPPRDGPPPPWEGPPPPR